MRNSRVRASSNQDWVAERVHGCVIVHELGRSCGWAPSAAIGIFTMSIVIHHSLSTTHHYSYTTMYMCLHAGEAIGISDHEEVAWIVPQPLWTRNPLPAVRFCPPFAYRKPSPHDGVV